MPIYFIFLLALIQGLTEFLPVSSSGHLILLPRLLNVDDQGLLIDIAMHTGTLFAVLIYFRKDMACMIKGCVKWMMYKEKSPESRLAYYLMIATFPALFLGGLLKSFGTEGLRHVAVVASTTLFYGIIMLFCGKYCRARTLASLNQRDALSIGCAQVLALIPGTSRSGICMIAANFLGFSQKEAARFSFLLSIPTIAGATLLGALDIYKTPKAFDLEGLGLGIGLSFLFGIVAIHGMLRFLEKYSLRSFGVYRIFLALFLFFYFLV
jgi:undecaprenyl-diphosphatase